jgi:hypothetical protein
MMILTRKSQIGAREGLPPGRLHVLQIVCGRAQEDILDACAMPKQL